MTSARIHLVVDTELFHFIYIHMYLLYDNTAFAGLMPIHGEKRRKKQHAREAGTITM
jgi:hypothetical protein